MIRLIGNNTSSKSKVPLELKVAVIAAVVKNSLSAKDSMMLKAKEFDHSFPPSYFKYPHTSNTLILISFGGEKRLLRR